MPDRRLARLQSLLSGAGEPGDAEVARRLVHSSRLMRERIGDVALRPQQAKLYSQHVRLRMGAPSLRSWSSEEALQRGMDAVRLVGAALLERAGGGVGWKDGVRRAAELLEWLDRPELSLNGAPVRLLAAAAYQLAGYPARAAGLWYSAMEHAAGEGPPLRRLLAADFPGLERELAAYWSGEGGGRGPDANDHVPLDPEGDPSVLRTWLADQVMSALGVVSAHLRWGDEPRLEAALDKLEAVADVMIHGRDPYSWLLARLTSEVARGFVEGSLRAASTPLRETLSAAGRLGLERYVRRCFEARRALAWPAQVQGLERLSRPGAFALCTPTASGKTTIAELAILQGLFRAEPAVPARQTTDPPADSGRTAGVALMPPARTLALYLTPSRALASEVEAKLEKALAGGAGDRVIVTGLYGGVDWGPTDAWLALDDRTVVVCTYQKAEALLRFLGDILLPRLAVVVVDEAHNVQAADDADDEPAVERWELTVESVVSRLLALVADAGVRVVALSAVAGGIEAALASWVSGDIDAQPIHTPYRSTRQLIGRLECRADHGFDLRYDLLDGQPLAFREADPNDTAYVPSPIPRCPVIPATWLPTKKQKRPEKKLRAQVIWAALHLAGRDASNGEGRSVLVYITAHIDGFAADALELLQKHWADVALPEFFAGPSTPDDEALWSRCRRAYADYFGDESVEASLLARGIAVHRGKLPGQTARLLVAAIERRLIRVVFATKTLAEGVNLPFEVVIWPTVRRMTEDVPTSEFMNVAGRAGRPGSGTEGQCLVVTVAGSKRDPSVKRYTRMLAEVESRIGVKSAQATVPRSPLALVLEELRSSWERAVGPAARQLGDAGFTNWLETVAPLAVPMDLPATPVADRGALEAGVRAVDGLDAILLATAEEAQLTTSPSPAGDDATGAGDAATDRAGLEGLLRSVWARTYARAASDDHQRLGDIFVRRGQALVSRIYPDRRARRRLYMSSLPPRRAQQLLGALPDLKAHLATGSDYATWTVDARFEYVAVAAELLQPVESFRFVVGERDPAWREVLRWWLDPAGAPSRPKPKKINVWLKSIDQNFVYRLAWGVGAFIGLVIDERSDSAEGRRSLLTLESWPETGLPWAVFWLKDLLTWGTHEPVAAFLLGRRSAATRREAEERGATYYAATNVGALGGLSPGAGDPLAAPRIRDWAATLEPVPQEFATPGDSTPVREVAVELARDFTGVRQREWPVFAVPVEDSISWCDPAGYQLAQSRRPEGWLLNVGELVDYHLDPVARLVRRSAYRRPVRS